MRIAFDGWQHTCDRPKMGADNSNLLVMSCLEVGDFVEVGKLEQDNSTFCREIVHVAIAVTWRPATTHDLI